MGLSIVILFYRRTMVFVNRIHSDCDCVLYEFKDIFMFAVY